MLKNPKRENNALNVRLYLKIQIFQDLRYRSSFKFQLLLSHDHVHINKN